LLLFWFTTGVTGTYAEIVRVIAFDPPATFVTVPVDVRFQADCATSSVPHQLTVPPS
jgi:hypothetical protein